MIEKTEEEIQALADKATDIALKGTKYRGMSYEEGIASALNWVLGNCDDDETPLD